MGKKLKKDSNPGNECIIRLVGRVKNNLLAYSEYVHAETGGRLRRHKKVLSVLLHFKNRSF